MRAYCSLVLVANYLQCLAITGLKGDGWGERERREQREEGHRLWYRLWLLVVVVVVVVGWSWLVASGCNCCDWLLYRLVVAVIGCKPL